eukprot:COSAG06_NODE_3996_length_4677_cov_1.649410_8_plen_150_part_00
MSSVVDDVSLPAPSSVSRHYEEFKKKNYEEFKKKFKELQWRRLAADTVALDRLADRPQERHPPVASDSRLMADRPQQRHPPAPLDSHLMADRPQQRQAPAPSDSHLMADRPQQRQAPAPSDSRLMADTLHGSRKTQRPSASADSLVAES